MRKPILDKVSLKEGGTRSIGQIPDHWNYSSFLKELIGLALQIPLFIGRENPFFVFLPPLPIARK